MEKCKVSDIKAMVPTYFLKYLEALGVSFDGEEFIYRDGVLEISNPYNSQFSFWLPKEVRSVGGMNISHNTISLEDVSVYIGDNNRVVCLERGTNDNYYLDVISDVLGNITIMFMMGARELGSTEIGVGEEHDTAQGYLDEVKESLYSKQFDDIIRQKLDSDKKLINAIFDTPNVLNRVTELMKNMPSTIDEGLQRQIDSINEIHDQKVKAAKEKIDKERDTAIDEARKYAEGYKKQKRMTE